MVPPVPRPGRRAGCGQSQVGPPSVVLRSRSGQSPGSLVMRTYGHERSPRTISRRESSLPEDP